FIGSPTCKASLSASSWASTEWLSSSASARATAIQRPRSCERAYCRRREGRSEQLPAWPAEQPSSAAKLPLGHSRGFLLAAMITRPHFRLNVFQKCRSHPLGGTEGGDRYIRGGRMSDAFASAHIARFIQAPAVFIRCILGNHFARTGIVLS